MNAETIGRNALRLWQTMNNGTIWCYNKLRQASQLSDFELNAAIGWLAREDTIEIVLDPVSNTETYQVRHFWDMAGL